MNASKDSVESLVTDILSGASDVSAEIIVCAPFPYLSQVEVLIEGSNLMLGAQNLNMNASGAFTGEVSAEMIKDFGANHVIVGHSERISLYGETSEIVAEKLTDKYANEFAAYIDAEHKINEKLTLQYGARFSNFLRLGQDELNVYTNNQPVVYNEQFKKYESAVATGVENFKRSDVISSFNNFEPRFSLSYVLNK